MSLALELAKERVKQNRCEGCRWVHSLDKADREVLDDALADVDIPLLAIYRVASNGGVSLAQTTFCRCLRKHHGAATRRAW